MRIQDNLYETLYGATNIPFCIIKKQQNVLCFPKIQSNIFTKRFIDICQIEIDLRKEKPSKPLVLFLQPGYYLGLYSLDEETFLIFGPSISYRQTRQDIQPWLDCPLYKDNASAMESLLLSLSPVRISKYLNSFCMAIYLYTNEIIKPDEIYTDMDFNDQIPVHSAFTQYIFKNREKTFIHTPYSLEISITKAIETGNISLLKSIQIQPTLGNLGILSFHEERQVRYMFVTGTAVFGRAAMRGGVDYETVCSMADSYCQKMDLLSNLSQIQLLQTQMMFDFCNTVAKIKHQNYSYPVKECCNNIQIHAHEKIVLRDLAEICQLSERRLSQKFKKETGVGIVDYIHKIKIDEAVQLLNYSTFTVNQISNYLGYNNQSYFTEMFKKYTGKTPNLYRSKNL